MEYLWYALALIAIVLLTLLLIAVIRAIIIVRPSVQKKPIEIDLKTQRAYGEGLAKLVQFPTIASPDGSISKELAGMHQSMKTLFPNVFQTMEIKVFENGSLLAKWAGIRPELEPLVLMAHQDVVPAPTEGWNHDPFAGVIENGEVIGRGTFDTKCTLYAFYQACEELILSGFKPQTDIYLASSSDEEVFGKGAEMTVEYLKKLGIRPKLVLDEGGAIVSGSLPTSTTPIALIGVLEKGFVNLKAIAKSKGGHSSTPPKNTPIAHLFSTAAPTMKFPYRLLFGNLWLFKGLMTKLLPKINPYGRALLSTTIAYTMMKGSDAANVIPNEAVILLNCRTHPIQDITSTTEVLRKIAQKYDVQIEIESGHEASPIVSTQSDAYQQVIASIKTIFPDVLISPYVILGGTDARHYTAISDAALRFSPIRATNQDLKKMHGINESLKLEALAEAVVFYKHLISQFH